MVIDSNLTHRVWSGGGRGQLAARGLYPGQLGQNPERQLDGVEVDRVFTDTVAGKSM
jgi:hypothetical protein